MGGAIVRRCNRFLLLPLVLATACGDDDDDRPAPDAGGDAAPDDGGPDAGEGPTAEPQFPDAREEALAHLAEGSSTPPDVRFEGPIPRFATFEIPVPGPATSDPVAQAFQFLAAYPDVYQLAEPTRVLHLTRVTHDDEGDHVFLGQHVDGHPVFDAVLAVHLAGGAVIATNGAWVPDFPAPAAEAAVTGPVAEGVALAVTEGSAVVGPARLVWFEPALVGGGAPGVPRLAHLVEVVAAGDFHSVVVDANDARVLLDQGETREGVPRKNIEIKTANNTVSDTCWTFAWEPGDNWFDENGVIPGQTPDADGTAAFEGANATYDAYYAAFDRRGWDGSDGTVDAWVHVGVDWANAAYVPGCNHLRFADGWVLPDVFGHEYTHAVIGHTTDLEYADQPGALNESFADVMAELLEPDPDWLTGLFSPGVYLRSLADPPLVGQPDHMLAATSGDGMGLRVRSSPVQCNPARADYNDCGFVHTNSGIPNKAWYLIAVGGEHNGYRITGLGVDNARQLAYQVMTSWVTRSSQLLDARDATVALARRWRESRILDDARMCGVQNAWASVGLGTGDRDCDFTPDPEDPDQDGDHVLDATDDCPAFYDPGQEDLDDDGLGDRCDGDADGDGIANDADNCPRLYNGLQQDFNADGVGDFCEDYDRDRIVANRDNCPVDYNPDQRNTDGDLAGDACDPDLDGDGILNGSDNCPTVSNLQSDFDGDGVGDRCDDCPRIADEDQRDEDLDHIGDACDNDRDGDHVNNDQDGCPDTPDPGQIDLDGNGIGTACDDAESSLRDGTGARLAGLLHLPDLYDVARIAIAPCLADGCPDTIGEEALTTLTATSPRFLRLRVVDDLGRVVGSQTASFNQQQQVETRLTFAPAAEMHFVAPGGDGVAYEGRRYFLEVAPDGAQGFDDVPLGVQITSEGL